MFNDSENTYRKVRKIKAVADGAGIGEQPRSGPPTCSRRSRDGSSQARSRKRLSVKPKRYLADPSLAVAQLGMGPESLLSDWQTFGLAFEAMCVRDLSVYARALPGVGFEPVRYYRDDSGLEADAVVELADGRWAAFEAKVGEDRVGAAVDSLRRLRAKLCSNPASRTRPPEFMAVIVGASRCAREVEEGIYVIPLRCLGA